MLLTPAFATVSNTWHLLGISEMPCLGIIWNYKIALGQKQVSNEPVDASLIWTFMGSSNADEQSALTCPRALDAFGRYGCPWSRQVFHTTVPDHREVIRGVLWLVKFSWTHTIPHPYTPFPTKKCCNIVWCTKPFSFTVEIIVHWPPSGVASSVEVQMLQPGKFPYTSYTGLPTISSL